MPSRSALIVTGFGISGVLLRSRNFTKASTPPSYFISSRFSTAWRMSESTILTPELRNASSRRRCSIVAKSNSTMVNVFGGKRGTQVTFFPSPKTFTMVEFDFPTIEHRLRELAFLNSGINIVLSDMRHAVEKREEMKYEGGVVEFVKYLDRNKTTLIPKPIMIKAEREGITVECALWWNDGYHESVLCFTTN